MASKTVRNASIAAIATAAVAGSALPASAYAEAAPADVNTTYSAPSLSSFDSATTEFSYSYDNGSQQIASASSVKTQSQEIKNVEGARAKVLAAAYDGIGGSYVWGGESYKAWDCSGFVAYVLAQNGVNVDSYTYTMKNQLTPTSNPQPGDIVFTNGYGHVGIYVGNGQMISALNPGQGTQLTSVDGGGFMPVDGYYTAGL